MILIGVLFWFIVGFGIYQWIKDRPADGKPIDRFFR